MFLIKKNLSLSRFPLLSRRPAHITPLIRRHIAQIPLSSMRRIILQRANIPATLLILDAGRQSSKTLSNTRSIMQLLGRLTLAWVAKASVHVGGCGALERLGGLLVHLLVVEVWVGSVGFVCGGRARGEGLSVEFGDCVVTDEFADLVLWVWLAGVDEEVIIYGSD